MSNDYLESLTDAELAENIVLGLPEDEAAAVFCAAIVAQAKGQDRPDILTCRKAAELAGVKEAVVAGFYGWVPMATAKGTPAARGWANVAQGSHGPGYVDHQNAPGLFVYRQLGGVLRAHLRFN